jgi:hypothetical protein
MSKEALIVRAPWMHPALAGPTPAGVRFLDPGLAAGGAGVPAPAEFYTPESLPLGFSQARRYVRDALEFGARFPATGDMASLGACGGEDSFSNTGMNMRAEMADVASLAGGKAEPKSEKAPEATLSPLASQMTLLLAWTLEERILELAGLADGLAVSSQRFDSALGLREQDDLEGEGEESGPSAGAGLGPSTGFESERAQAVADFPWRRSVEHLATFLPDEARLLCCEPFIREAWEASGAVLEQVKPAQDLPAWAQDLAVAGRLWGTRAELWRLAGMPRAQQDRPLLDRMLTAYYCQPE